MHKKTLIKSAGIIGFGTATSRVLGLVRDMVIAGFFGTSMVAEAFVVAFRIPNMLRDLVAEGAANAALVPVFSESYATEKKEDFFRLVNVSLNIFFAGFLAISVLGIIFAPVIVRLIAPGFAADPEKLKLTIWLTQLIFPFLITVGLAAFGMGFLNTMGHFSTPAFSQAILNAVMIMGAYLLCPQMGITGLAIGALVGGVAQLVIQVPPIIKSGFRLKTLSFRAKGAIKIFKLLGPRVIGTSIYQLNIFVDTIFASLSGLAGAGAVAALYFANRLIQLPIGIFGNSIAQAVLPTLSTHAAKKDYDNLKDMLSFSLRVVFLISIPAAVGLMVLAKPIVTVLFQRGEFSEYSTLVTTSAVFFYCFGLFFYSAVKMLVSSFYSMHDTVTPVKVAALAVMINVIFISILIVPLKVGGIALATSISSAVNFFVLYYILRKRIGCLDTKRIISSFTRILLAALVMAGVCMLVYRFQDYDVHVAGKIINLIVAVAFGIISFLVGCVVFKVSELKEAIAWISKRK